MNGIRVSVVLVASVCLSPGMGQERRERPAVNPQGRVWDGFQLTIAVADVKGARFMAFDPGGRIYRLSYRG
jgi:hypothetical protein